MAIKDSVFWYVECEQCSTHINGGDEDDTMLFSSRDEALAVALDIGWMESKDAIICPNCAEEQPA